MIFLEVDKLYRLHLKKAEERFKDNQHVAKSRRGALPLDWTVIDAILNPGTDEPSETLIDKDFQKECRTDAEDILGDLRKVLIREREKMSLSMVQQVDALSALALPATRV